MSIKPIDYKWRTKRGLQTRLAVAFTIIMIGFLIMLLFGCFHSKRPKKWPITKQVYIGMGLTANAGATTKPLAQSHSHVGEPRTVTDKKLHGSKKKAALKSSQMRVVRAKRLKRDRERREQVAYIFQDAYPSDNGGVMWR